MKLIFGLGNYGAEFEKTPHNAGFMLIDTLLTVCKKSEKIVVSDLKYDKYLDCEVSYVKYDNEEIMLAKPKTYMNLTGTAFQKILLKNSFNPEDILVVYDDLDILLGNYKISRDKQPKDHNGVDSVRKYSKNMPFYNLRIGIETRNNHDVMPGDVYVVKRLSEEDCKELQFLIDGLAFSIVKAKFDFTKMK